LVNAYRLEDAELANQLKEMKVVDGCRWLIAAGFPQYVQMFKDDRFPISMENVKADHQFLDKESLHALMRRLNSLNKLADTNTRVQKNKSSLCFTADDCSTTEVYALSQCWRFDELSQQWLWSTSCLSNQSFNHAVHPSTERTLVGTGNFSEQLRLQSESVSHSSGTTDEADSPKIRSRRTVSEECESMRMTSGYASEASPQSNSSRRSRSECDGNSQTVLIDDRLNEMLPEVCTPLVASGGVLQKTNGVDVNASKITNTSQSLNSSVCSESPSHNGTNISLGEILKRRNTKTSDSVTQPVIEDEAKPIFRRHSFYDNLSPTELNSMTPDLQRELDVILNELYYNIDNLEDKLTSLQNDKTDIQTSADSQKKKSYTLPAGKSLTGSVKQRHRHHLPQPMSRRRRQITSSILPCQSRPSNPTKKYCGLSVSPLTMNLFVEPRQEVVPRRPLCVRTMCLLFHIPLNNMGIVLILHLH